MTIKHEYHGQVWFDNPNTSINFPRLHIERSYEFRQGQAVRKDSLDPRLDDIGARNQQDSRSD